ncbi:MAG TPA: DUF4142 domain-containing protein [Bryobacteraceae bacterium]|nr:DUF4142 domain-containing protein [Bryobacteraceae bacterium]
MHSHILLSGACCFALFAAGGVSQASSLSKADQAFLSMAAKDDMTQAHEGQMAEKQAERAEVKDLAKTLVKDHTSSYEQLTILASKTGAVIPKGIDSGKDASIRQLAPLKGASFDRTFTHDEIEGERRLMAVFKREAQQGQNPDVKAYASRMVPVLEKDLKLAEDCGKPVKAGM